MVHKTQDTKVFEREMAQIEVVLADEEAIPFAKPKVIVEG
jgi:hypothetical protein